MKTRAAIVHEPHGPFLVEELEVDNLRADEILIKIAGAGICHTDLICRDQVYPVPLPGIFGHEGSGVVEKVGSSVKKVVPGDHVVLSFQSCSSCRTCLRGEPAHCENIFQCNFSGARGDGTTTYKKGSQEIHGNFFNQSSFAELAIASERNTVKVSRDVPLELLGPLGCGIQTGAGAVINSLKPAAGSSIAIFGCGSVGLAALMAAKVVGCTSIIAIDLLPQRLELAKELGATDIINAGQSDVIEQIQQLNHGGVDFSLECSGLPSVLRQAIDSMNNTGTCGLIGAAPPGTECNIDMNSIMFGRTLKGVIEGDSVPDIFIPQLIDLYSQGQFPFDRLVSYYNLDNIETAVQDMEAGKVVKPIVKP
jgi:aryl-alcohol dehydrogenase